MSFEELIHQELSEEIASPLLASFEEERTHCLVLNREKIDGPTFLKTHPNLEPHPFIQDAFYFSSEDEYGKSFAYDVGGFSIQDGAAMMVPFLLHPEPNDLVLDLCAAPGGKSVLASILMENEGCLIANDLSYPRAKTLSSAVERLGRKNIIVTANDFSSCYLDYLDTFDKIILDAPCSGTAMFRKNEQARKEWSLAKAEKFSLIQAQLLEMAGAMLKPGGTLIYSTCSFLRIENEDVVLSFLASHPEFKAIDARIDSPSFYHSPLLKEGIHLFPHLFKGEGQYMVLLQKEGEKPQTKEAPYKKNTKLDALSASYNLPSHPYVQDKSGIYRLPLSLSLKKPNVLRAGLKIASSLDPFLPDFAFARYLDASFAIPLSELDAKAYLQGETFPLSEKDGWYPVSFGPYTLGWVKIVKGVAKNHYPKGLRHRYLTLN